MQKPFKAADLVYMMKNLIPQTTIPTAELSAIELSTAGLGDKLGGLPT